MFYCTRAIISICTVFRSLFMPVRRGCILCRGVCTWAWGLQRKQQESDEAHDIMLFFKWPPDVEECILSVYLPGGLGIYLTAGLVLQAMTTDNNSKWGPTGLCMVGRWCTISKRLGEVCACWVMWLLPSLDFQHLLGNQKSWELQWRPCWMSLNGAT